MCTLQCVALKITLLSEGQSNAYVKLARRLSNGAEQAFAKSAPSGPRMANDKPKEARHSYIETLERALHSAERRKSLVGTSPFNNS